MKLGGHTHSDHNNTLGTWPEGTLSSDETAQLLISEPGERTPQWSLGGRTGAHKWWQHHPKRQVSEFLGTLMGLPVLLNSVFH